MAREVNIGSLINQCSQLFFSYRGGSPDCFEPKYPNLFTADVVKQRVKDLLTEHEVENSERVAKVYRYRPEIKINKRVYDGLLRGDGFYASHTMYELIEPENPPRELEIEKWAVSRIIGETQMEIILSEYRTGDDETTRRIEFFMGIGDFASGEPGIFKVNIQGWIAKSLGVSLF